MATIEARKDKAGKVTGYRVRACVGRDEHNKQVWRTTTIPRPEGLTPKKEEREVERLADAWEQNCRAEYEKNKEKIKAERRAEKKRISLVEFIDKHWIPNHVEHGPRPHTPDTVSFYKYVAGNIKNYFQKTNPGIKLAHIGKEEILEYLSWMRKETEYSAATIKHHYGVLRSILDFAKYMDYIDQNPCEKIRKQDRPKKEEKEVDFLEEEEALRFLSCLDSQKEIDFWKKYHSRSPLMWKCLCNTLILTGLRRGELVGLQWSDLNKKEMILHVRRNVTIDTSNKQEKDPEKKIHIGVTKGKRTRTVPITAYLVDLLQQLKAEYDEKYQTLLPRAYIFCRTNNPYLPIYPTEPTRQMRKYIKRHNLPDVSPHDLRHTAASLAISAGADVRQVQGILGHRDPALTLKFYTGITEKRQRQATDGIENILRPKKEDEEKKA